MRRGLLAVMIGVAMSAPTALWGKPTSASLGVSIPVHELNMCGSRCGPGDASSLPASDLVLWLVASASPRPWFVMLNEVCSAHLTRDFVDGMSSMGYSHVRTVTDEFPPTTCGDKFGNSMFYLGTAQNGSWEVQYERQNTSVCDIGAGDQCRKFECVRTRTYIGDVVGCNTHLHYLDSVAEDQADELRRSVLWVYNDYGRFVGGDFNINQRSGNGEIASWYANYWEVDPQARLTFEIMDLDEKLDYVFADKAHWPSTRSAPQPFCNHGYEYGDHCHFSGTFSV